MTIALLMLLQMAAAMPDVQCARGDDAVRALEPTVAVPRPRGLTVGHGNDYFGEFLVSQVVDAVVSTTDDDEEVTGAVYYTFLQDRVCWKTLTESSCPQLGAVVQTVLDKTYPISHSAVVLKGQPSHPPFALIHARDGNGNISKIETSLGEHPAIKDVADAFEVLTSCKANVERALHEG